MSLGQQSELYFYKGSEHFQMKYPEHAPRSHSTCVLAWEDGFYEPIKAVEMPMEFSALSSQTEPTHFNDRIGFAVDKMSLDVYSVGQGIVGQVAFTNRHQWISSSRYKKYQYPTGWHDQFAAGIKTIAVIAVHQGVVQLGSTQTISEDFRLIGHVKELFGALQTVESVDDLVAGSQREGIYGLDPLSTTNITATKQRMPAISDVWSSLAARGRHLRDDQGLLPSPNVSHELHFPSQSLDLRGGTSLSASTPPHHSNLHPLSNPLQKWISSQGQAVQPPHSLLHKLGLDLLVQSSSPQSLTLNRDAMANVAIERAESSYKTDISNHIPLGVTPLNKDWPSIDTDIVHAKSWPSLQTEFIREPALPIETFSAGGGDVSPHSSGMSSSRITAQAHAQNVLVSTGESPLLLHQSCVAGNDALLTEARNLDTCSVGSTCNAQDSLLDVQMLELFDNQGLGELMFLENISSEGQYLSSLQCDNVRHSLETLGKKQESCPDAPSDDVLQKAFSSELEEFDNFLASLKKEQEEQSSGLTYRPPDPAVMEDISKSSNRSFQKASFWDPNMVHGSLQPALEDKPVTTLPALSSPKLKEETSTSCQTVESNVFHVGRYDQIPKVEPLYRNSERDTIQGSQMQALVLSATMQDEPPRPKKRARPGENARPRPKDRQQIQDRVHELRSIIPSSTKCSIDALLEKTIKYMSFLQTATEDAGKWKEGSKLQDDEGNDGSNIIEGGTSWAVELGGQERSCPLIVEDLSQPQHLLVEMLCEEKGSFLEIAKTIRGLGLTILKGLMEVRNKKMWARFVVKADGDVHRVHITWSLMQLLESSARESSNVTDLVCE